MNIITPRFLQKLFSKRVITQSIGTGSGPQRVSGRTVSVKLPIEEVATATVMLHSRNTQCSNGTEICCNCLEHRGALLNVKQGHSIHDRTVNFVFFLAQTP